MKKCIKKGNIKIKEILENGERKKKGGRKNCMIKQEEVHKKKKNKLHSVIKK